MNASSRAKSNRKSGMRTYGGAHFADSQAAANGGGQYGQMALAQTNGASKKAMAEKKAAVAAQMQAQYEQAGIGANYNSDSDDYASDDAYAAPVAPIKSKLSGDALAAQGVDIKDDKLHQHARVVITMGGKMKDLDKDNAADNGLGKWHLHADELVGLRLNNDDNTAKKIVILGAEVRRVESSYPTQTAVRLDGVGFTGRAIAGKERCHIIVHPGAAERLNEQIGKRENPIDEAVLQYWGNAGSTESLKSQLHYIPADVSDAGAYYLVKPNTKVGKLLSMNAARWSLDLGDHQKIGGAWPIGENIVNGVLKIFEMKINNGSHFVDPSKIGATLLRQDGRKWTDPTNVRDPMGLRTTDELMEADGFVSVELELKYVVADDASAASSSSSST